jgi:hypothetical protein
MVDTDNNEQDNQSNPASANDESKKKKDVKWSEENENILVEWADIAQCYKWLNARSHQGFSYMHAWFTIPAITLSTITGTASFAQSSLPANIQSYAPSVIGTVNIFIGILTTVQQYLKISELNEAHRVSSISWDKFARNIRIELSKAPMERMEAGPFIKICRQEFDRLMETSPMISRDIIDEFNKTFKFNDKIPETKYFKELRKPDICDVIISAERYKYGYKEPLEIDAYAKLSNTEINAKSNERLTNFFRQQLEEKNNILESKEKEEAEKRAKKENVQNSFRKAVTDLANRTKQQLKFLEDYVVTFQNMYGRKPIEEEINDYAKDLIDKGDIESTVLVKFLSKYTTNDIMNMV